MTPQNARVDFFGREYTIVRSFTAAAGSRWGPRGSCGPSEERERGSMPPDEASCIPAPARHLTALASISVLRARSMRCDRRGGAPSTGCPAPLPLRDWNREGLFEVHARGESSGWRSQKSASDRGNAERSSRRFPMPASAPPQNFHLLPSPAKIGKENHWRVSVCPLSNSTTTATIQV